MTASNEIGVREQKRRATLRRITESAMKLFTKQGYEATTLDAIAADAGISRRTFFHYFKSKDDILISQEAGMGEQLVAVIEVEPDAGKPFRTVREAMRRVASSYSLDQLIAIDKVMISIEAVQQRKQASYIRDEGLVFTALVTRWPDEDPMMLRLVAQLSIGLSRLALDAWRSDGGRRPILHYLDHAFDIIEAGL